MSLPSAVLVVEGDSDRAALEAVALRRGRDLAAEGVQVVAVGGATNVRRFLTSDAARGVRLAVLCDKAEEAVVREAWARAGADGAQAATSVEAAPRPHRRRNRRRVVVTMANPPSKT